MEGTVVVEGYNEIKRMVEEKTLGDKLTITGWYHFPLADPVADDFYNETIDTVKQGDWDLIKIMTCGNYMPVAYGADYEFSTNPEKWDGVFHSHPITCAEDAANLPALDATNPTLAAEVEVDRRIVETYKGKKPVLATLFDPLSWVQELSTPMEPEWTLNLMRTDPDALLKALDALEKTNDAFLDALIEKAGIDGIFLATKFSTSELVTPEEHRKFVVPYLKHLAEKLEGRTWFNMVHVHGDNGLYFDDLIDLGFQAFNWECVGVGDDLTTIADLRAKTDKVLITGIDQWRDFQGTREEIKERLEGRLKDALEQNAGGAFIFGPGCTLPLTVDRSMFTLIEEVVREAGLR